MKKPQMSRRQLLVASSALGAAGFLAYDPVRHFLRSMVRGMISQSSHSSQNSSVLASPSRNFLQIHMYGSPSRWIFDNPYRPNDSDPFISNPGVFNRFTHLSEENPHLIGGEYADVKVRGINMPHMWRFPVPKAGGGHRPLTDLIDNMLILRGCDMGEDGHPVNSAKMVSPVLGSQSITGLVAESTRASIPAISVGSTPANRSYRSKKGIGLVNIPSQHPNYASFLLNAFLREDSEAFRDKQDIDSAVSEALDQLQAYSMSNHPGSDIIFHERKKAEKILRQGVSNLSDAFSQLVKKYSDLIDRSLIGEPIPGITDKKIPGLRFPMTFDGDLNCKQAFGMLHTGGTFLCNDDLREIFVKPQADLMAQHFALAEFVLTEGLSGSILLAPSPEMGNCLSNLLFNRSASEVKIVRKFDPNTKKTEFSFDPKMFEAESRSAVQLDSHGVGCVLSTVANSLYYRALSSSLLELIDQLKLKKVEGRRIFDETVIHLAAEFDRIPTEDCSSTEHNYRSHISSIYSGIIDGPMVLGNIYAGRDKADLKENDLIRDIGTTGQAAPIEGLPNEIMNITNVSSTLSKLLRVEAIIPRNKSLVDVDEDKVTAAVESARNIKGWKDYV